MAAEKHLPSRDQFLCCICLDVLSDPVSTPCGHNFCKTCITQYWETRDGCQCPVCKKNFGTKPELNVNTLVSEMVSQFRQEAQQEVDSSSKENQECQQGDVPCDACTGSKQKALKSCLVCLVSYCSAHLEPHQTVAVLRKHQLVDPVENLEARMCVKHSKPLELFCRTDQVCVCALCPVLDHKGHAFALLSEEFESKKGNLLKTNGEIQLVVKKRKEKVEEFQSSVRLSQTNADNETAEGVKVFTSLNEFVKKELGGFVNRVKEKQQITERHAGDWIKELEQEISALNQRSVDVKQLLLTEDPLDLLQTFQSLNMHQLPTTKDWTRVSIHPPSQEGAKVSTVVQMENAIHQQVKKVLQVELKRVRKYEVATGQSSSYGFLGNYICSGRSYFEIHVGSRTRWFLGVARTRNMIKSEPSYSPANGFWVISFHAHQYKALEDPPVSLSMESQIVGVFVDYEEGLVSFHDVDTAELIYSFTGCRFDGNLRAYFKQPRSSSGYNVW
ncbi:tripartite motif-containing protein 75-like [Nelusetta ayraudi]|uniref:tripartite motif-containing protein 75-like n=1 Tax=Nelusetta ayraudi TaxID=303726 RepID=UPI003F721FCF